jgi:hypothetical protein
MRALPCIMLIALLATSEIIAQTGARTHPGSNPSKAAETKNGQDAKLLAAAKTAAFVVRATSTVSCPGGAPGDCIRTDSDIVSQVQDNVATTELWGYFEKADPTQADILLDFRVEEGSIITFTVRDSDSGKILFSEVRDVVSLDNDIRRIVAHFLQSAPPRTEEEREQMQSKRQCREIYSQYVLKAAAYQTIFKDYQWKTDHQADAIMDECRLHWKDFVCLDASAASRTNGTSIYADDWNNTIVEYQRKLQLQNEEIGKEYKELESMRATFEKMGCTGQLGP